MPQLIPSLDELTADVATEGTMARQVVIGLVTALATALVVKELM